MNNQTRPYHTVEITPERRAFLNTFDFPRPKHLMYGLLEVDVTLARQFIAQHKARSGETLSFTGYLAFCLGRALEENKEVQAYRKGRRQLILFDDVDVGLLVERKDGEKRELSAIVVRGANRKTFLEIHHEIRAAQSSPVSPTKKIPTWFRNAMLLPWPLCRLFTAAVSAVMRRDPATAVLMQGTVGITSIGMFGKDHSGWGLTTARHSLILVVSSIAWKPAVVDGQILPREILNLTLVFDHDVIDGAPAARFTRRLVELIESGYGLGEAQTVDVQHQESEPSRQ
jgi:pyruvate/2-oxoglutarate dehydrogenase complex dihydrolipoamide acyltransferase (E2) component